MAKIHKTWKILPPAPKDFHKKYPQYSNTVLNLLYHRIGKDKKTIADFFNPDFKKDLPDPFLFSDMKKAVKRILAAVKSKEGIAIFGDYDVDGITSVTILYDTLCQLGTVPEVFIPDRRKDGYGMNLAAIKFLKSHKINLIITVDCGVRDIPEIKKANELGIDVVVTDHHLPGKTLPPAFALINCHIKKEKYPFKELSGAGVAFKLACALIHKAPRGVFKEGYEKWLLDLVALGTVADMVPLIGENRTLVKYGLIVLGKTQRVGIRAIFASARLPLSGKVPPDTTQISFQIAPRLNAAGRMDHANTSFELLKTKELAEAQKIAVELEKKNGARQRLTDKIVKEIEERVNDKMKVIFEGDKDWPVGVAGLAAGKICEKYARPAFVYNISKGVCRGSIRSISKFKVVRVLEKCKDLLTEYGGHDFAGGFSFPIKNRKKMQKRLQNIADKMLKYEDLAWETKIDERLELQKINWDLHEEIKKMEPFGVGNPTPLFLAEQVELTNCQTVGNGQKHLKMWFRIACPEQSRGGNANFETIAFGKGEKYCTLIPKENPQLDIVFEIASDEWNGQKKLQLIVRDLRLSPNK
jgi:single-stranded-DNA-specific exonuclease